MNPVNDKPIIKLFMHNNNYFVYDTYTNCLLKVSKEHYKELFILLNKGLFEYITTNESNSAKQDILSLIKKGLFKSCFVNKIEHPLLPFVQQLLDNCVNELVIQVTQDCNFNCRYCTFATENGFDHTHSKKEMSWEIAKKAIDYIYNHSSNAYEVSIYFYGGEPLLNFTLIKKIVSYTQEVFKIKKVKYGMTINASIMTDEMISFFIKYDFHIAISFDGNKDIQNKHRKFSSSGAGTFDTVSRNVEKIKNVNPAYFERQISVMPVVFDDENFEEVEKYFLDRGIKNITPLNVNLRGIDYKFEAPIDKKMKKTSTNRSSERINNISVDFEKCYMDKVKINSSWHHNGPCVAGVNRLFVDIYGNFFPCEKICENKAALLGNVENGIGLSKVVELLNVGVLSEDACKNCWAMRFCNFCMDQCVDIETETLSSATKEVFCNMHKLKILDFFKNKLDHRGFI